MVSKTLYAVVVFAVSLVLVAADDCDCLEPQSQEVQELVDFLSRNNDDENFFVVGGELVPYNCDNCIEKNRKKRKIHEQALESKRTVRSPVFRVWQHANDARNKCPIGYRRVAFLCMKSRIR